jgi:hypothetical protein
MERLERVAEAGGRLLKAERLNTVSDRLAGSFLLTFDVGRLLVEVMPEAGKIRTVAIEGVEDIPSGAEDASEDDPWWRVIGFPLTRVAAGDIGAQGLSIQFRADNENPKIITVRPSGSEVQVSVE